MSTDFKWGILGTGGIAHAFAKDLSYLNNHSVVAVGSRSLETAKDFANAYPGCVAYGSYAELVADPNIDAIYVATPHPMHKEHALLAIAAGKPTLCEKPFTVNRNEASEIVNAARSAGVPVMEAMWMRFLPHIHKVRAIIKSGVLGKIMSVEADHGQRLSDQGIPRLVEPSLAGGALLDLGIYPVSFAHMVLGAPKKISAIASFTDKGVDAQTSMLFDYGDSVQAILTTTMDAQTPCRATISGVNGRLEIDRTFYNPASMRVTLFEGEVTEYPSEYKGHGLREQAVEFARVVQSGEKESPILTLDDSLEVMGIMDSIRKEIGLTYPFEN